MGKKQALVLAGGASHAAYHVGVLKALLPGESRATGNRPLEPDIIAGISAGAFNAAVLLSQLEAADPSPAGTLEDVWLERLAKRKDGDKNGAFRFRFDARNLLSLREVARQPLKPILRFFGDAVTLSGETAMRGTKLLAVDTPLEQRLVEQFNLSSFISTKPFEKSIRRSIRFDHLRRSKRYLRIGAVRWKTGRMHYFTGEDMTDELGPRIVRASAAVPGIFPRVKVGGVYYCDGAAVENTPLSGAIDAGADVLHVITSVPPVESVPVHKIPNTFDTLYRFIVIRAASTLRKDIEAVAARNRAVADPPHKKLTIHVHHPPKSLGSIIGLLNFDRSYLSDMIRSGHRDAVNHDCDKNGCVLLD